MQTDKNGATLHPGDRVRVVSGKYAGETGTVNTVGEPFGGFKGLSIDADGPQRFLGPIILTPRNVVKESFQEDAYSVFLGKFRGESLREASGDYKVPDRDRRQIADRMANAGLDGNGRFESMGSALALAQDILADFGLFTEQAVTVTDLEFAATSRHGAFPLTHAEYDENGGASHTPCSSMLIFSPTMMEDFNLPFLDGEISPISTASADYPNASWEVVAYLS